MRGRGHLAAPLAIVVAVVACSSTSEPRAEGDDAAAAEPTEPAPDAAADAVTDSAMACALPGIYGSKECMACVGARCCDAVTACENDPTCKTLQRCALDCLLQPDAGGCLSDCLATYPAGEPLWNKVDRCWFGKPPKGCLVECTS